MSLFDAIVIGSGPAGVFAAYPLRGKRVLVLDVGHQPPPAPELDGNLFELRQRQTDLFRPLIGENFESLHNLHSRTISLKLKSPLLSYIVKDSDNFAPVASSNFEAVSSFAQGGLANAWGAGVYRFTDRDLNSFPIRAADLEPYYNELTRHIGISGASDDLDPYFGSAAELQDPIRLSRFAGDLLQRYHLSRDYFQQRKIFIGRARLAVLTRRHRDRDPYQYNNLEFFKPHDPAIYNPAYTLREMAADGAIEYKPGYLALRYTEREDAVEATARNLATGAIETFRAKTLLLAAGTLNSTKLVLESHGDYDSRLPILDNPMSCIPLFRWDRIGASLGNSRQLARPTESGVRRPRDAASHALRHDRTASLRRHFQFPADRLGQSGVDQVPGAGHGPAHGLLSGNTSRLELHQAESHRGIGDQL